LRKAWWFLSKDRPFEGFHKSKNDRYVFIIGDITFVDYEIDSDVGAAGWLDYLLEHSSRSDAALLGFLFHVEQQCGGEIFYKSLRIQAATMKDTHGWALYPQTVVLYDGFPKRLGDIDGNTSTH
jgi:hypothetical protein